MTTEKQGEYMGIKWRLAEDGYYFIFGFEISDELEMIAKIIPSGNEYCCDIQHDWCYDGRTISFEEEKNQMFKAIETILKH